MDAPVSQKAAGRSGGDQVGGSKVLDKEGDKEHESKTQV